MIMIDLGFESHRYHLLAMRPEKVIVLVPQVPYSRNGDNSKLKSRSKE